MSDHRATWRDELIETNALLFPRNPSHPVGMLSVGDGWRVIVEQLVATLAETIPTDKITIDLIESKYGTMRVHLRKDVAASQTIDAFVEDAVDLAEARSSNVCEVCGAEGSLHAEPSGWLRTACREHAHGSAIPETYGQAGLHVKRRFLNGRLTVVSCKHYVRALDAFVDLAPEAVGLDE